MKRELMANPWDVQTPAAGQFLVVWIPGTHFWAALMMARRRNWGRQAIAPCENSQAAEVPQAPMQVIDRGAAAGTCTMARAELHGGR